MGDHVEVPGVAAARTGLALAGEAHAAALLDPRRDVHAIALDLAGAAAALAGGTGVLDLRAGAVTATAGLGDREQPLRLRLHAAAVAERADRGLGAGLGAGAPAGGTRRRQRHRHRDLGALHRLLERDVDLGLQVAAALGPGRAAASAPAGVAEQVGEDVAEAAAEAAGGSAGAERAGIEAAAEDPAAGVVRLALLRVGQDRVRLLHLLEALLGVRVVLVAIRVVLPSELAVRLLDLLVGGLLVDAERLVRIVDGGHRLYPETTTRAGRSTVPLER